MHTKTLRILLVAEPGIDGVFRHVEGLILYLIDQGQEVHLAYSNKRGSPELIKLVEFVKKKGGQTLNLNVSNSPGWNDIVAGHRLFRMVRNIKPDIIHGHSSKAGALSRMLRFIGISAIYFYTPHAYYGLSFRPGIKMKFYNGVERFLGRVGTTINISEDERRFAIENLKVRSDRCMAIHNPVNTDVFRPVTVEDKRRRRHKLNLPENAKILGSMGRLSLQKDPETLYRSFAEVLRTGMDIYLIHVGQGELSQEMEDLGRSLGLSDRLIRFNYFRNPAEFYAILDAFIITSCYEAGWPIVLLEALASDLPVISGTGPGTSGLPSAGLSHCWTAQMGDVSGFAKAIEEWQKDIAVARLSNHRDIAVQRFSPKKCFGEILKTYQQSLINSGFP